MTVSFLPGAEGYLRGDTILLLIILVAVRATKGCDARGEVVTSRSAFLRYMFALVNGVNPARTCAYLDGTYTSSCKLHLASASHEALGELCRPLILTETFLQTSQWRERERDRKKLHGMACTWLHMTAFSRSIYACDYCLQSVVSFPACKWNHPTVAYNQGNGQLNVLDTYAKDPIIFRSHDRRAPMCWHLFSPPWNYCPGLWYVAQITIYFLVGYYPLYWLVLIPYS